jgi:O-antigen ligase
LFYHLHSNYALPMRVTPTVDPALGQWLMAVERWWLRVGVFLLPLAYTWDTYDRFVLPKLLLARVLVIGLLILFVARSVIGGALTIRRTRLDLPILVFLVSAFISTVFAFNQNVAVFGTYSRYDGLLTTLTYAGVFWLSVQALADRGEARTLLRILLASGYLVAAVAIIQSVTDSVGQQSFVPAFGTLGQKNVLGMFLAMLAPLAFLELVEADAWSKRILALNAFAIIVIALVLSMSRSAWLGATIAGVILLVGRYRPNFRIVLGGIAVIMAAGIVIAGLTIITPHQQERRPDIWLDSLTMIASRPVFGYGPDNFGLVYPSHFQTKNLGTQQVDKAHAEVLQVAATQGLVGFAAYGLIIVGLVRAFWAGGKLETVAILAGLAAYQVALQVNFTALAAALPFWVVAAAAMEAWGATRVTRITLGHRRLVALGGAVAIAGMLALAIVGVVRPYLADSRLLAAVQADVAGRSAAAQAPAQQARDLAPRESVYAVEVANIAFERADWVRAAAAYLDAAALGTYNPLVYRNLALADRNLGRISEARAAARKAFELDRYDPANRALVAQLQALLVTKPTRSAIHKA